MYNEFRNIIMQPTFFQVQVDDNGNLIIARILEGGMIDKQKLLHAGDVILEVNGIPVSTPEDLQTEVAKAKEHVTLKIGNAPAVEQPTHSNIVMANGTNNGVTKKLAVSNLQLTLIKRGVISVQYFNCQHNYRRSKDV